jgi:hypothetical protein
VLSENITKKAPISIRSSGFLTLDKSPSFLYNDSKVIFLIPKKPKKRNPYVIPSKKRKAGPHKNKKKEKEKRKCREEVSVEQE